MNNHLIEQLLTILPVETDTDGWSVLTDKRSCTLYASRGNAALTVSGVESFKLEGDIMIARTHKTGTYAIALDTIFSVSLDETSSRDRRAGFST